MVSELSVLLEKCNEFNQRLNLDQSPALNRFHVRQRNRLTVNNPPFATPFSLLSLSKMISLYANSTMRPVQRNARRKNASVLVCCDFDSTLKYFGEAMFFSKKTTATTIKGIPYTCIISVKRVCTKPFNGGAVTSTRCLEGSLGL